ncbi:MAG TPA: glycosyltransferase [Verrucomicrobiae bacterium]|jgi:glycosyltransferase involved in cell wall biosynthesis
MPISAYIPCFNNASTLAAALHSIRGQSVPIQELIVIDDGSKDSAGKVAQDFGAKFIRHEKNAGRGAARSRGITEAANDFILSCDATNALALDFVERALPWFESQKVAAVFGRMWQEDNSTAILRWRGRHLFKTNAQQTLNRRAPLATGGVLFRKSHVLAAGNFDACLRHSEDADLGGRLLAQGYEVIFDPAIHVFSLAVNTLLEVLERYWRWYAGKDEEVSWKLYFRQIVYSLKVMARQDMRAGDLLGVPISLIVPHYQFWCSLWRNLRRTH